MTTKREKLLAGLEVCRNNPKWDQRSYDNCFMSLNVPGVKEAAYDFEAEISHIQLGMDFYGLTEQEFYKISHSSSIELPRIINEIAPE